MWSLIHKPFPFAGLALVFAVQTLLADVKVGDRFPVAKLPAGAPALGAKATVVDFCASWCAPCRESFPVLSAISNEFSAKGVVILGVSIDQRAADFETLKRKWKPEFPVVHDSGQTLVAEVRVPTMPTSYVLDSAGVVRAIHVGFHAETAAKLRADLNSLLSP